MKRLYLIITLIWPAAFAQEQHEIGIGGSPMVGGVVLGNSDSSEAINIAAMPDGSSGILVIRLLQLDLLP